MTDNFFGSGNGQQEISQRDLYAQAVKAQPIAIPTAEQERLEALKLQDPEAWRKEMNSHEEAHFKAKMAEFDAIRAKEAEANSTLTAKQKEEAAIASFNAENKVEITAEMLEFDIPPRLKAGKDLTSKEFLAEAAEYLKATKVLDEAGIENPNLGGEPGVGGELSHAPDDEPTYADFGI